MTVLAPFTATTVEALTFEGLYRDLHQPLARFVLSSVRNPEDAEDICQEVWAKVAVSLHELREPAAARTWVYRIARHAIIDGVRRRSRRPEAAPLTIEPPAPAADDPAVAALSKEQSALAWQTLATLPERQRMALYLKEVEECRYSDIAEVLGCSESAVETLLFRARRSFAERFGGVADNRAERCTRAQAVMRVLLDGEGDTVLRRGVQAHLEECPHCAEALPEAREMSRLRGALLLPPLMLTPDVGTGSGFTAFMTPAVEALRAVGAKVVAVLVGGKTAVAAGTVATTAVASLVLAPVGPTDTAVNNAATQPPPGVASAALTNLPATYGVGDASPEAVVELTSASLQTSAVTAPVVPVTQVVKAVPAVAESVEVASTVLLEEVAVLPSKDTTGVRGPDEALLHEAPMVPLDAPDTSGPGTLDSALSAVQLNQQ